MTSNEEWDQFHVEDSDDDDEDGEVILGDVAVSSDDDDDEEGKGRPRKHKETKEEARIRRGKVALRAFIRRQQGSKEELKERRKMESQRRARQRALMSMEEKKMNQAFEQVRKQIERRTMGPAEWELASFIKGKKKKQGKAESKEAFAEEIARRQLLRYEVLILFGHAVNELVKEMRTIEIGPEVPAVTKTETWSELPSIGWDASEDELFLAGANLCVENPKARKMKDAEAGDAQDIQDWIARIVADDDDEEESESDESDSNCTTPHSIAKSMDLKKHLDNINNITDSTERLQALYLAQIEQRVQKIKTKHNELKSDVELAREKWNSAKPGGVEDAQRKALVERIQKQKEEIWKEKPALLLQLRENASVERVKFSQETIEERKRRIQDSIQSKISGRPKDTPKEPRHRVRKPKEQENASKKLNDEDKKARVAADARERIRMEKGEYDFFLNIALTLGISTSPDLIYQKKAIKGSDVTLVFNDVMCRETFENSLRNPTLYKITKYWAAKQHHRRTPDSVWIYRDLLLKILEKRATTVDTLNLETVSDIESQSDMEKLSEHLLSDGKTIIQFLTDKRFYSTRYFSLFVQTRDDFQEKLRWYQRKTYNRKKHGIELQKGEYLVDRVPGARKGKRKLKNRTAATGTDPVETLVNPSEPPQTVVTITEQTNVRTYNKGKRTIKEKEVANDGNLVSTTATVEVPNPPVFTRRFLRLASPVTNPTPTLTAVTVTEQVNYNEDGRQVVGEHFSHAVRSGNYTDDSNVDGGSGWIQIGLDSLDFQSLVGTHEVAPFVHGRVVGGRIDIPMTPQNFLPSETQYGLNTSPRLQLVQHQPHTQLLSTNHGPAVDYSSQNVAANRTAQQQWTHLIGDNQSWASVDSSTNIHFPSTTTASARNLTEISAANLSDDIDVSHQVDSPSCSPPPSCSSSINEESSCASDTSPSTPDTRRSRGRPKGSRNVPKQKSNQVERHIVQNLMRRSRSYNASGKDIWKNRMRRKFYGNQPPQRISAAPTPPAVESEAMMTDPFHRDVSKIISPFVENVVKSLYPKCPLCVETFENETLLKKHVRAMHSQANKTNEQNEADNIADAPRKLAEAENETIPLSFCQDKDRTGSFPDATVVISSPEQSIQATTPNLGVGKVDWKVQKRKRKGRSEGKSRNRSAQSQCKICDETTRDMETLIEHIFCVHLDNKPYKCPFSDGRMCGDRSYIFPTLDKHIRRNHGEECHSAWVFGIHNGRKSVDDDRVLKYICALCDISSSNKEEFLEHLLTRHDRTRYCCIHCGIYMKDVELWKDHIFLFHPEKQISNPVPVKIEDSEVFSCNTCYSEFSSKSYLARHRATLHTFVYEGKTGVTKDCTLCHTTFTSENDKIKHFQKNHLHWCDLCKAEFVSDKELSMHVSKEHPKLKMNEKHNVGAIDLTNMKYKHYKCEICPEKFSDLSFLRMHGTRVHGLAEFVKSVKALGINFLKSRPDEPRNSTGPQTPIKRKRRVPNFPNTAAADDKEESINAESREIQCPKCPVTVSSFHNTHLVYDNLIRRYCAPCDRLLSRSIVLRYHNEAAHGILPENTVHPPSSGKEQCPVPEGGDRGGLRKCPSCARWFEAEEFHLIHTLYDRNPSNRECPLCNKTFTSQEMYRKHMHVVHSEPYNEKMRTAPSTSKNKNKEVLAPPELTEAVVEMLISHAVIKISDVDTDISTCKICLKNFKNDDFVKQHIFENHKEDAFTRVMCTLCNGTFASKSVLDSHLRYHHSDKVVKFKCPFCDTMFSRLCHLRHHNKKFHDGRAFNTSDVEHFSLSRLKTISTRSFCSICPQSFATCEGLQSHVTNKHFPVQGTMFCHICGLAMSKQALGYHLKHSHEQNTRGRGIFIGEKKLFQMDEILEMIQNVYNENGVKDSTVGEGKPMPPLTRRNMKVSKIRKKPLRGNKPVAKKTRRKETYSKDEDDNESQESTSSSDSEDDNGGVIELKTPIKETQIRKEVISENNCVLRRSTRVSNRPVWIAKYDYDSEDDTEIKFSNEETSPSKIEKGTSAPPSTESLKTPKPKIRTKPEVIVPDISTNLIKVAASVLSKPSKGSVPPKKDVPSHTSSSKRKTPFEGHKKSDAKREKTKLTPRVPPTIPEPIKSDLVDDGINIVEDAVEIKDEPTPTFDTELEEAGFAWSYMEIDTTNGPCNEDDNLNPEYDPLGW